MSLPELVTSRDGTRLAVWRGGAGPALLLVHGTTADHTRWAAISSALEQRFTVYAMDRRGRGASGDGAEYSLAREGEDVEAVVDSIGGPVALLGHSYGALCCLQAVVRTRTVHRLILYEPPIIEPPPAQLLSRLDGLVARNEREEALLTFFREVVRVPEPQLDAMRSSPAWPARVAAAHTTLREVRMTPGQAFDAASLRTMHIPTLLLVGGDSPAFFQEATRLLHATLPNGTVHVIPGQQHVAMDIVPDEFVRVVSSFLAPMPDAA
ncbi:MAG TPA: alpha/beta hydrolase [Longimicrobiales bacterium]